MQTRSWWSTWPLQVPAFTPWMRPLSRSKNPAVQPRNFRGGPAFRALLLCFAVSPIQGGVYKLVFVCTGTVNPHTGGPFFSLPHYPILKLPIKLQLSRQDDINIRIDLETKKQKSPEMHSTFKVNWFLITVPRWFNVESLSFQQMVFEIIGYLKK